MPARRTPVHPLRLAGWLLLALIVTSALTRSLVPSAIGFGLLFAGIAGDAMRSGCQQLRRGPDRPWSHHLRELMDLALALLIAVMGIGFLVVLPLLVSAIVGAWIVAAVLTLGLLALVALGSARLLARRLESRYSERVQRALRALRAGQPPR